MNANPIKRSQELVPVSREHHATLLFCWKLRQGARRQIAKNRMLHYMGWFWVNHLQPHFKTEEQILFRDTRDPLIHHTLLEHQLIATKLRRMVYQDISFDYAEILQLADLIEQHTRNEEREVFPWLERHLSPEALTGIGRLLETGDHSAKESYSDEFWIIKK